MFFRRKSTDEATRPWRDELMRWAFLAAVAVWIFHPFATSRFYGTGDALWYSNMLADFVLQWRAGVFPVWVGQTEYAFNGAVYPLRVAPMYQHVGGVLDILTLHRLSFFQLQHLIVIITGLAATATCYTCLASLAPRHRWNAALLTALYITCPAILSLIFVQDLYMSWMTVPLIPIAVYGLVRTFEADDFWGWWAVALGVGGLWLSHAPIAFWTTAIVGVVQLLRLLTIHRTSVAWQRALGALLLCGAVAQYPFISIRSLGLPETQGTGLYTLKDPLRIVEALKTAFPGSLLPLSDGAGQLSDLQLGYGLLTVIATGLLATALFREKHLQLLSAAIAFLALILIPIPGWTEWFWLKLVPEQVRVLTFYWPMHRLYLIMATLAVFSGALAVRSLTFHYHRWRKGLTLILVLCCCWSFWETRRFEHAAALRISSAEETSRKERPENRLLMTHSYGLFTKLPPYFSNGVMDPDSEFRWLNQNGEATESPPGTLLTQGSLTGRKDDNPGIINFFPKFKLEPGRQYILQLSLSSTNLPGILQIKGRTFFREYILPVSGEDRAFGSTEKSSHRLSLWTTQKEHEEIQLRFIPTSPFSVPSRFADFEFFDNTARSLQVLSRIPLTLRTQLRSPTSLETPLMWTEKYQASSGGAPIRARPSKADLVVVDLPSGKADVIIKYDPPAMLIVSYWISLVTWIATWVVGCLFAVWAINRPADPGRTRAAL